MERVHKQESETVTGKRAVQAKSATESKGGEFANRINNSPAMVAQRKKLNSLFGDAIQRVEDEEPLQSKSEAVQRVEEEELLQGKFETAQRIEEEEPLQGKFETAQRIEEEEEPIQEKFEPGTTAQLKEESAAKTNNTGLPDNLKSGIESLSGISMDNVKAHYNSPESAQLNALAYAQGTDIHIAGGQEKHLPHKAWHVVQQAQGRVKPTMQMKDGVPVNDDKSLEHEADVMGGRAISVGAAQRRVEEGKPMESGPIDFRFMDNRPETNQAAQLQLMADNYTSKQYPFQKVIQRVVDFDVRTEYLDIDKNIIPIGSYQKIQRDAKSKLPKLNIREDNPGGATAKYRPAGYTSEAGGNMIVKTLGEPDKSEKSSKEYNDRLISVAHETSHFIDDMGEELNIRSSKKDKIFTEWRAFAAQSAVASQLIAAGKTAGTDFSSRYLEDKQGFETFFWDASSKTTYLNNAWVYGEWMVYFQQKEIPAIAHKALLSQNAPNLVGFEAPSYVGYEDLPSDQTSKDFRKHRSEQLPEGNPVLPFLTDVSGKPEDRSKIEGITESYIDEYSLADTNSKKFIAENLPQLKSAMKFKNVLESESANLSMALVAYIVQLFTQSLPSGPKIEDVD